MQRRGGISTDRTYTYKGETGMKTLLSALFILGVFWLGVCVAQVSTQHGVSLIGNDAFLLAMREMLSDIVVAIEYIAGEIR